MRKILIFLLPLLFLVGCGQEITMEYLQDNAWVTDLEALEAPTSYRVKFFDGLGVLQINPDSFEELNSDEVDEATKEALLAMLEERDFSFVYELQEEQIILGLLDNPDNSITFNMESIDDGIKLVMEDSEENQERIVNLAIENIQEPQDFEIILEKVEE